MMRGFSWYRSIGGGFRGVREPPISWRYGSGRASAGRRAVATAPSPGRILVMDAGHVCASRRDSSQKPSQVTVPRSRQVPRSMLVADTCPTRDPSRGATATAKEQAMPRAAMLAPRLAQSARPTTQFVMIAPKYGAKVQKYRARIVLSHLIPAVESRSLGAPTRSSQAVQKRKDDPGSVPCVR